MSSLKRIVCLANSWKHKERCIAGIDLDTGKWVRPISNQYDDGRVPQNVRLLEGREPELLDILQIPLADTGEDFGFECENLTITPGKWQLLGKARPNEIIQYCDSYTHILHNSKKYVNVSELKYLPLPNRRTLQLVHASKFFVSCKENSEGLIQWKGTIETKSGQILKDANITDPVFTNQLDLGDQVQGEFLITVSLSMPWSPANWEGEPPCWKLIAGVIALSPSVHPPKPLNLNERENLIAKTNQEMQRVAWTVEDGRKYLLRKFNKRSRQELTLLELTKFLQYLESLPDDFGNLPF